MTGSLACIVLFCCWSLSVFTGCSGKNGKNGENGKPGSPNITAKGVTTAASGKRWANVDVEVNGGRAKSPQVTLATDSVSRWPIVGYGGAVTEGNFLNLREEQINDIVDAYFDPAGLDYNMARLPIHATANGYVFDNVSDDFELKYFDYNLTGDRKSGKMNMIEKILKKKRDVKILGSVWTPPSWMKLGDHSMDGSDDPCLKRDPRYHKVWAKYLVTCVDAYERLGVPIWAITQQNEPQNYFTQSWGTCIFEPEAQLAFIRDHLGPAMKAANKSTKLFFSDDDKNFLPDVAKLILEDEVAAWFVDGAAVHWYTMDQYAALKDYKEKYLDKYSLISTEATNGDPTTVEYYKTDWDRAMHYAHGTIVDFFHGGSTVFLDWVMTGTENLITVNKEDGKIALNTPYYTFGQITKYFKPGYSVLTSLNVISPGQQADGTFPAGIEAMAAINPSRTEIVIVVLCDDRHESNATVAELLIELDLGGGRYSTIALKDVEQRSVTTVVLTTDKF